MPSVVNTHFLLDVPTLFAVTVFISLSGGLLLLFSWMQNRSTPALALFVRDQRNILIWKIVLRSSRNSRIYAPILRFSRVREIVSFCAL